MKKRGDEWSEVLTSLELRIASVLCAQNNFPFLFSWRAPENLEDVALTAGRVKKGRTSH